MTKQTPEFTRRILLYEYSESIFQSTNKALNIVGILEQNGSQYLEGKKYRIWRNKNRGVLIISAKDSRGKILQFEYGKTQSNLSAADIEAFQIFQDTLEQELTQLQTQKSDTL